MPLQRTGIAIVAGALGTLTVAAIGVSAPRSGTLTQSPPSTPTSLLVDASPSLPASVSHPKTTRSRAISSAALSDVVKNFCTNCHNPRQLRGNLDLTNYHVDSAPARLDVSEKMIRKLRAQMMPPPGSRRPAGDTLLALAEAMENIIDRSARPNPGTRTFQRLNRAEYERAVRDLLSVEIDAGDYLPLDTKSANFDNIADVQSLSPTLLEAYLNAAAAVSRIALGDPKAPALSTSYPVSVFSSQNPWDRVEGTPYGTRGGLVVAHPFPADGMYSFRVEVRGGVGTRLEDVDVSIDGQRAALLKYERGIERSLSSADAPQGADYIRTEPILVKAGQQRVSVAFVRRTEGPYEDLIRPHEWSLAASGSNSAGTTAPPHIMELTVVGPLSATGVSESPSRRIVFSCRPANPATAEKCADEIITRLGTRAYRRPLTKHDRDGLMGFYRKGAAEGGEAAFEHGIRTALQVILASPHFVFRFERVPPNVTAGHNYNISDVELASRLSFFLWGTIPDAQLLAAATAKKLSEPATLNAQVRRMLADPRAEALAERFAAQWLRLQDLDLVHPDPFWFPDFDQQLADAMRRETELLFADLVRRNASLFELWTADYTFVNERLARHYGIPNVAGSQFRRVTYADSMRRGLLGHGSILVQTSLANRTSPVLRGKWVMEVLMGMPPPPPPPGIPDLEETADSKDGRQLTTRERMELHRSNATCRSCHQYMDPIGLALDNYDVTGKWRYRENGAPLDTRGTMYDGRAVTTPMDLTRSLLSRPVPLARAFTENLMAYAVGRRVEDFDQPAIRAIVREAEAGGYKMWSFINAVVKSPAFRSRRAEGTITDSPGVTKP
jgi:hypothetical protein